MDLGYQQSELADGTGSASDLRNLLFEFAELVTRLHQIVVVAVLMVVTEMTHGPI